MKFGKFKRESVPKIWSALSASILSAQDELKLAWQHKDKTVNGRALLQNGQRGMGV